MYFLTINTKIILSWVYRNNIQVIISYCNGLVLRYSGTPSGKRCSGEIYSVDQSEKLTTCLALIARVRSLNRSLFHVPAFLCIWPNS